MTFALPRTTIDCPKIRRCSMSPSSHIASISYIVLGTRTNNTHHTSRRGLYKRTTACAWVSRRSCPRSEDPQDPEEEVGLECASSTSQQTAGILGYQTEEGVEGDRHGTRRMEECSSWRAARRVLLGPRLLYTSPRSEVGSHCVTDTMLPCQETSPSTIVVQGSTTTQCAGERSCTGVREAVWGGARKSRRFLISVMLSCSRSYTMS